MTLLAIILLAANTIMLLGIYVVGGIVWYAMYRADQTRHESDRAARIVREADEAVRAARASRTG